MDATVDHPVRFWLSVAVLGVCLVIVGSLAVYSDVDDASIPTHENPCVIIPNWEAPNSGAVRVGQYCDKGYQEA